MKTKDGPHMVDVHVGQRLRHLRHTNGMSQDKLAAMIGVTFQQVQKYERGSNRVSASRLWEIGKAMGVSTDYFFVGMAVDGPSESAEDRALREFQQSDVGYKLATAAMRVPSAVVLGFVRAIEAVPLAYGRPRKAA